MITTQVLPPIEQEGEALHPGYYAILAESKRLGWPKDEKSDDITYYDKAILTLFDYPEFGWSITPFITSIYMPYSAVSLQWAKTYQKEKTEQAYYWFDGTTATLLPITIDELVEKLEERLEKKK